MSLLHSESTNGMVAVLGPGALAERVAALRPERSGFLADASLAVLKGAWLRQGAPRIVVVAGPDGISPVAMEFLRAGEGKVVLVLLTSDHRLAPAPSGLEVSAGVWLLRDDASDGALRDVLERALGGVRKRTPAAAPASGGAEAAPGDPPDPARTIMADAALRIEDDWAQIIAHDLRTPLGINNGYLTHLLDSATELTPGTREILARVLGGGEWMLRLVDGLLDVAGLRHRGSSLRTEPTALDDLLRGVAGQMDRLAEQQGVRIEYVAGADTARFGLDRMRIEQVLHNLITNALKFSPAGGVVRVSAKASGMLVRFEVSDQGPGMSGDEVDAAFVKFSARARGRGLGLAIARAIVELHGGTIWVESDPGQGSRFCFTLTAAGREASAADPASEPQLRAHGTD